ncbi:MAG: rhodanese-like domain-containing protein [Patescibacteria group bacterium]|nr:rhodanese-like domain-containing protein [Patescibacteria group bacterium]
MHQNHKRYPRTQLYQYPQRNVHRSVQTEKRQQKKPAPRGVRMFVASFVCICLICVVFIAKKEHEHKQETTASEEFKKSQNEDIEPDVAYADPAETFKGIRNKNVQLVDIREPGEYDFKHIESSVNIPISRINERINAISRTKKVIIIDRENNQIGKIFAEHLKNEGVHVKYLEGGILNYSQNGYELISLGSPALTEDLIKVASISAEDIKNKIKAGQFFIFLDVRPIIEFSSDNIEGSVNIPLEHLEDRKSDIPIGTLLVYDSDAIRSFQAASRLYDMNIIDVYNSINSYENLKRTLREAAQRPKQERNENENTQ